MTTHNSKYKFLVTFDRYVDALGMIVSNNKCKFVDQKSAQEYIDTLTKNSPNFKNFVLTEI